MDRRRRVMRRPATDPVFRRYVMRRGVLYDAATLDEMWPRSGAFGAHPWVDAIWLQTDARGIDYHDKATRTNQGSRPRP